MNRILIAIVFSLLGIGTGFSQVSITDAAPTATINFSSSMQASVGFGVYTGAGFSPTTVAGRLNSNAWELKGWENGDLNFTGGMSNPAHGRGSVASAVLTEGVYAYTDNPHSTANPALLIQPSDNNFSPGSIALRIRNNGSVNMTQLQVDYDLFVRNDEAASTSFTFSHSADNMAYIDEPALDYVSPDVPDAFQWTPVGVSPMRSMIITGINVAPGGYYYIRWSGALVSGSGAQDEFGLDNIVLTGTYGAPAPEINVLGGGLTILHNDMTPRVADGTEFANTFTGGSQSLKTYIIQNIGGAPLTVSDVTITGANAADFTIHLPGGAIPPPTGVIPGVSGSTISTRELNIRFSPSAPGTRTAIINIASDDANEPVYSFMVRGLGVIPQPDIDLTGNTGGTGPIYSTNMTPLTTNNTLFGTQVVGGTGQLKDYKIKNNGTAALLVLTGTPFVQISGANPADFVVETQPNAGSVFPSFTKTFTIRFNPTAPGIRTAIVTIPNNDVVPDVFGNAEGPYTFLVQGVGVAAEIDVQGNSQPIVDGSLTPSLSNHTQFDNQNVATGFQDRIYTIRNTGNYVLTLGTVTLSGSPDFTVQSQPSASVAIGGSTTFTVRFNPSASGLSTATVNIPNDDYNESPYDFLVRGYGLDYTPCTYGVVETIVTQDFETTPATPTWGYSISGGASVAAGTGYAVLSDGGATERFLGGRSLQIINGTSTINLAAVNTTQFSDIELVLKLSALSVNATEGTDFADKVTIAVSTNGTIWSNELQVTGNTDAKWSFASGTGIASSVYDGNNVNTVFDPGSGGFLTTNGYGTMTITGLPKQATLYVRIIVNNNNANEIWSVDNISLFGRKELFTQWNGSSWSDGLPTPAIKAVINGAYDTQTSGSVTACKCQINATVGAVTIREDDHFLIESELENYGIITVENGGSLVQKNDLASNIGNVRVWRHTTPMTLYDYTYWSSPVVGQTFFNLSPLTQSDKYYAFNPVINNWENVAPASTMTPGRGYIIRAPENFSTSTATPYVNGMFSGVANNGFIQPTIAGGAGAWNLIGNPYPSAIDADAFIDLPANLPIVNGTLYFWTHNTPITNNVYTDDDYAVYNKTGGTMPAPNTGDGNNSAPDGNIASGQGFFVEALSNGVATFNNSMRILGNNMQFFRSGDVQHTAPQANEKHRVWINLTNDQGAFKQALIGYIENATDQIDRNFDGAVLDGGNVISWYSILENKAMSIQGRALPFHDDDIVPMGYVSTISGSLTVSIENTDGILSTTPIYLEDKALNIVHNLSESPYTFTTVPGTFDTRFQILYDTQALSNPDMTLGTGVMVAVKNRVIDIVSYQENIKEVAVYDLLGRKLTHFKNINADTFSLADVADGQQSLIVKTVLESGKVINQTILY